MAPRENTKRGPKPTDKMPNPRACPFCREKSKNPDAKGIDYKDVNLLRKFISDRGKIRARRITGVSVQEQRLIATAIKNAREMALLPYAGAGR